MNWRKLWVFFRDKGIHGEAEQRAALAALACVSELRPVLRGRRLRTPPSTRLSMGNRDEFYGVAWDQVEQINASGMHEEGYTGAGIEAGDPSGQHDHGTYILALMAGYKPGQYVQVSGTSAATPLLAGAVARIVQKRPDWSVANMRRNLTESTDYFLAHGTHDPLFVEGFGIVDALLASDLYTSAPGGSARDGWGPSFAHPNPFRNETAISFSLTVPAGRGACPSPEPDCPRGSTSTASVPRAGRLHPANCCGWMGLHRASRLYNLL